MKHPALHFIKYMMIKDDIKPADVMKRLEDWGFLTPEPSFLEFVKVEVQETPNGFDPANRVHRTSVAFLRKHGVFEFFHPTDSSREAWKILSEPKMRLTVEQALLARLDRKAIASKLNKKHGWHLTSDGLNSFHDMFWNVDLLTWDEWGRFLYGRSGMYERYLALLQAPPELAMFQLQIQQNIESKNMIQRAQEIAYFTLEEVNLKPGTAPDKVKAIGVLGKTIVDCHEALSTSDMALKDILKNFERFRMEHPQIPPPDIKQLAPGGNFTGSGNEMKTVIED